eukprot:COSAG01_NODE_2162_length_8259_cov_2.289371_5_plen_74_part_00
MIRIEAVTEIILRFCSIASSVWTVGAGTEQTKALGWGVPSAGHAHSVGMSSMLLPSSCPGVCILNFLIRTGVT